MASGLLGRTNRVFPSVWLSLALPSEGKDLDALVAAALDSGAPLDVTTQPALWGGLMRGTNAVLTVVGTAEYERATDEAHACDLVHAHLISILSSIGRESIDVYYLRVRRVAEEYQISGALQALELAKQEGHVGHIGICCDGSPFATLGTWQFHDAFELLLVPRNHYDSEAYDMLAPLAKERRVGIVTSKPLDQLVIADLAEDHPVLVGVRSAKEVEQALAMELR